MRQSIARCSGWAPKARWHCISTNMITAMITIMATVTTTRIPIRMITGGPMLDDFLLRASLAGLKGRKLPMVDRVEVSIVEENQPRWLSFLNAEADVLAIDSVTASFKTLIDGYERRIDDLTAEVTSLRDEVKKLRQALDERPRH